MVHVSLLGNNQISPYTMSCGTSSSWVLVLIPQLDFFRVEDDLEGELPGALRLEPLRLVFPVFSSGSSISNCWVLSLGGRPRRVVPLGLLLEAPVLRGRVAFVSRVVELLVLRVRRGAADVLGELAAFFLVFASALGAPLGLVRRALALLVAAFSTCDKGRSTSHGAVSSTT